VREFITRIRRGAAYSDKYGNHPGTLLFICFVCLGAVAGMSKENPISGPLVGASMILVVLGPVWLYGCYQRGK
jgi:hypothetical protein